MIKQFSVGDIITRPFKTFKNWKVQSVDANETDQFGRSTYFTNSAEVNRGRKLTTDFYPSESSYWNQSTEPMTPNGKYERIVYSITDAMFYRNAGQPTKIFGLENVEVNPETGKKEVRKINDKVVSLRLSENYWGEKILPSSVHIVDRSNLHSEYNIYDDGMTNLYIEGSHFSNQNILSAVNPLPPLSYWDSSSAHFYTVINDVTQSISYETAKNYMNMGMDVWYSEDTSGNWKWDNEASRAYYQPENERFGQSVSAWYKYIAVGSPMDSMSLSDDKQGYAAIFKYDEPIEKHRLVKKFYSPQSQAGLVAEFGHDNNLLIELENNNFLGLEQSGSYEDGFGYSVCVKENFLAVGAPTGSACFASGSSEGFVYVYDRYKGGSDNWGIVNILQGESTDDRFGNSVSIDNDIMAIGAPGVSGSKGAVYIFRLKRYMDKTVPCRSIETASFWYKINECGLPTKDITGSIIYTGTPTPFYVSGNFSWGYETTLTSSIGQSGDNFGWVLETSNDRLIVGNKKINGDGYAALFVCNYTSASLGGCPTASWSESMILKADETLGNLDSTNGKYSVIAPLSYDGFGWSVALDGDNMIIGSYYDTGFLPYTGADLSYLKILGAAYFYHSHIDECAITSYHLVQKTFGDINNRNDSISGTTNWFGRNVKVEGLRAAVSSEPSKTYYSVNFSGAYILESSSYQSTGSTDAVLGIISMFAQQTDYSWKLVGDVRRNKESDKPFGVFGRGLSLSSDFLVVGEPIYNYITGTDSASIYDHNIQISASFSPSYSGSVFVYDLEDYENNPLVGNMFYKNGYAVITSTSSNYQNIFTGTGSFGFDMAYQGTHTIYENEYMVSIRPGEFNYSTNPSSLIENSTLFDVNQDGTFDFSDLDLIMRYLNKKRFFENYVFDDNGVVLEQDAGGKGDNWWANDILLTESEDVLLQESDFSQYLVSSSFTIFTKKAFDYIETNLIKTGILDIDGNGSIDIKDGAILTAFFMAKLTPTALLNWIGENSIRKYVSEIEEYIGKYTGVKKSYVDPNFFGYQLSSSYDLTGSYLAPVITTIGLYDHNRLVGVAKLGRPIKNLIDWPINIIVRFDT